MATSVAQPKCVHAASPAACHTPVGPCATARAGRSDAVPHEASYIGANLERAQGVPFQRSKRAGVANYGSSDDPLPSDLISGLSVTPFQSTRVNNTVGRHTMAAAESVSMFAVRTRCPLLSGPARLTHTKNHTRDMIVVARGLSAYKNCEWNTRSGYRG